MNQSYDFTVVEQKWRPVWAAEKLYETGNDPEKPDHYILDFFPYPSGSGLSVGHCRNYVPTCIATRYKRMQGFNVLHPMGWDAFGLPAENYAIAHGVHPGVTSRQFAANYKRQLQLIECAYDWEREIDSTDPDYYRWTQSFFLLLYQRGLAYRAVGRQWWCPTCQTILANEQVEQGRCWRCDGVVEKKELAQWYFRITAYADRLEADLALVDWPERIKTMQRNWIGRSEGTAVVFVVAGQDGVSLTAFTTRPDTLFGVTFVALAPEHPLVEQVTTPEQAAAVAEYVAACAQRSELERQMDGQGKTGVFSGRFATHPLTGQPIPIWIADYVLPGYGSGAVMGVPAHDGRDAAFAQQYGLPVIPVVRADGGASDTAVFDSGVCYTEPGVLLNSGNYSGLSSAEAGTAITAALAARGLGERQVTTKLRDWLISRQRYWGAPIPIVHCPVCGAVPVPESELPVRLPELADFAPAGDGRSPLARAADWVQTSCPQCGGAAQRETDTMDGFACSSWYFLRFASPREAERPFDPEAVARWLPVDTYVGGAEHAVMHLLYARFWTKVMYDAGLISFVEPFITLKNQGVLMSPLDGKRMSKSRGNVVTPDEVVAQVGADALRLYVVFLGPFEADVLWDGERIRSMTRFLERIWRLVHNPPTVAEVEDVAFEQERHRVVQRLTDDMERFRFNTAVAALMEYLNYLTDVVRQTAVHPAQWQRAVETFTLLLAPFAPFMAEEVWRGVLGQASSVHRQMWPVYDEAMLASAEVVLVVQVNGKVRDRLTVPAQISQETMEKLALNAPNVRRYVNGKPVQRVIVVGNKVVNVVV